MLVSARTRIASWLEKRFRPEDLVPQQDNFDTSLLVEQARQQWKQAQVYFDSVHDPELVDLAINNLQTAERRYNYLLKQLREQ